MSKKTSLKSDVAELKDVNIHLGNGISIHASHATFNKLHILSKPIAEVWSDPWRNNSDKTEESLESSLDELIRIGEFDIVRQKEYHTDGLIYHDGKPIAILEIKTDVTGNDTAQNRYKNLLQLIGGYWKVDEAKRSSIEYLLIMTPKYVCTVSITASIKVAMDKIRDLMKRDNFKISPSKMWSNQDYKDIVEEIPKCAFKYESTSTCTFKKYFASVAKMKINREQLTKDWVDFYSHIKHMKFKYDRNVYYYGDYVLYIEPKEENKFCVLKDSRNKTIATSQGTISNYLGVAQFLREANKRLIHV